MRRTFLALLCILLALTLSGCWDRRELDDLAIVTAIAIDLADEPGKVLYTMEVIKPGELKASESSGGGGDSGGGQGATIVVGEPGYTPFDSIRFVATRTGRKLYFPHSKVVIIGREAAEQGVRQYLDVLIRDPEPRLDQWVVIASGKAKDALEAESQLEKAVGLGLGNLANVCQATSQVCTRTLKEFYAYLTSKTTAPHTSHLEVLDEKGKKRLQLVGTSVFKGDKLVGQLDKAETRGQLFINDEIKSGVIIVDCLNEGCKVSLEITESNTQVVPEIRGQKISILVKVNIVSNLGGQMCLEELTTPEAMHSLSRRQSAVVQNEMMAALEKAREYNTDIFSFGEAIHKKYPDAWRSIEKDWDKVFPELDVNFEVYSMVQLEGLTTKPPIPQ